MNRAKLDEVISLVSRIIEPAGFECLEAEWSPAERILRLYVDRLEATDGRQGATAVDVSGESHESQTTEEAASPASKKAGIDLEGCVAASRLLVELEELDALVPGAYTLEVSSPGIERPLRSRKHFEQHIGDTVQVKLADKDLPRRNGTGKLVGVDGYADQTQVTVQTEQGPWTFPLGSLQRASLVYDWNGASKH